MMEEYKESLYRGNELSNLVLEREEEVEEDDIGDQILRSEFERALKDLSRNKAPGTDELPLEILSALGEEVTRGLFHLVQKNYDTGVVPSDFRKNIIIPIPK